MAEGEEWNDEWGLRDVSFRAGGKTRSKCWKIRRVTSNFQIHTWHSFWPYTITFSKTLPKKQVTFSKEFQDTVQKPTVAPLLAVSLSKPKKEP